MHECTRLEINAVNDEPSYQPAMKRGGLRRRQSRWSKAKELQIDPNQCRHLKGYYGIDQLKSVAGVAGIEPSKLTVCYHTLPGNQRRRGYDSAGTGILDTHL